MESDCEGCVFAHDLVVNEARGNGTAERSEARPTAVTWPRERQGHDDLNRDNWHLPCTRRGVERNMKNILIVHGDKALSRAISSAFAGAFQISRSPSVRDAVALIAAGHRYDAILCAPVLADGSSDELCRELSASCPSQCARVVSLRGADSCLLDGDTREGVFLARTAAYALVDRLDAVAEVFPRAA